MTREEFDLFLLFAAGLCGVMAVINLLRRKKRGTSAFFLAGAFVAVGVTILLYRAQIMWAVSLVGFVAFALLVGDFAVRSRDRLPPGGQP